MARLVVDTGVDKGMVHQLPRGAMTVGRSSENAVQILDRRASRKHVAIRVEEGHALVRDLESRNGTVVNDIPLEDEQLLHNGDRIVIGDTLLIFESDPAEQIKPDNRSSTVRLVADLAWGDEKGKMAAGVKDTGVSPPEFDKLKGASVKDPEQRLRMLYHIADVLSTVHKIDPLLETVMDALFALLKPDRAFVMLVDEQTGVLSPRLVRSIEEEESREIAISRAITDRCLTDRVSLLISDALSDVRFKASESIVIQKIRSAICAPLIFRDEVLGLLYFDTKSSRSSAYAEEELELATGLANQTSIGLANIRLQRRMLEQHAIDREMEIAKEIQGRLLPREMPKIPNFEFAGMSLAARKVGGDYFDLIQRPDGRIGVALADVSGKGVPAAILIASVRSALQVEGNRIDTSVTETIENLNGMVFRDTANNMFVTMVYGLLNPGDGGFEYVNAGHPYPLLFGPDGSFTELESGGCFLGVSDSVDYVIGHAAVRPGSTLILYSDGVTDTMSESGDLYGRQRLVDVIRDNLADSAQDLRDRIYQSTVEFRAGAEQFDDFTLLIVRNTEGCE